MTKKQLLQRKDELAYSMIEAEGDTYFDLQVEMDEIDESLYLMDCLGVDDMADTEGFDQVIDDLEDWSDLA
jgi:hypothetical protein